MAKRKGPSTHPQAQHKARSRSSQHDKRKRPDTPNSQQNKTPKAKVSLCFLATSRLVSGVIHVAIVRFDDGGWAAYFCTDAQVDVRLMQIAGPQRLLFLRAESHSIRLIDVQNAEESDHHFLPTLIAPANGMFRIGIHWIVL